MENSVKYLAIDAIFFLQSLLWIILTQKDPLFLAMVLLLLGIALLMILKNTNNIYFYLMMAVLGPLVEIICVFVGVWHFSTPDFFGIPYWLPFYWGLIGLCFGDAYKQINNFTFTRK